LNEFEDLDLLSIKNSRSKGEYCWTSTPSIILYSIKRFNLTHCTYLDADLFFYNDPICLIDEMGENDVSLISHRYSDKYDKSSTSGKYCVQFMTFKNTINGLTVLEWWRNACIEWCYGYYEDGKFGDQMYLDNWTELFFNIYEITNLGAGVAPWNMQQYDLDVNLDKINIVEFTTQTQSSLIFFHFHDVLVFQKFFILEFFFQGYDLSSKFKNVLYVPYVKKLIIANDFLKSFDNRFSYLCEKKYEFSLWAYFKKIRRRFINNENIYYFYQLNLNYKK
jgi:hypothetical protein